MGRFIPRLLEKLWLLTDRDTAQREDNFSEDLVSSTDAALPPLSDQIWQVPVDQITGDFPIARGVAPLPPQLRGIFWLQDQDSGSALMSFSGGSGHPLISTGAIDDDGRYFVSLTRYYKWSWARGRAEMLFVKKQNAVYEFQFDDPDDPTHADIILHSGHQGNAQDGGLLPSCVHFDMSLGDSDLEDDEGFPGSVIWTRNSYVCCTCFGLASYKYKLVQVMDEHGKRIQPAWDAFKEYISTHDEEGKYIRMFQHESNA